MSISLAGPHSRKVRIHGEGGGEITRAQPSSKWARRVNAAVEGLIDGARQLRLCSAAAGVN